jgi:hypothetical protein
MDEITSLTLSQAVQRRGGGIRDEPPLGYLTNINRALLALESLHESYNRSRLVCRIPRIDG